MFKTMILSGKQVCFLAQDGDIFFKNYNTYHTVIVYDSMNFRQDVLNFQKQLSLSS